MPLIRLFLICQCCMINHHVTHNQIWEKRYGFYTRKELQSSLPLRPGRNYTMVSCNDFRGNLLVLFWTMCNSIKGPCDTKSLKISTVYDVWFPRYRPFNMKLATNSALVLVFINFLWPVYIRDWLFIGNEMICWNQCAHSLNQLCIHNIPPDHFCNGFKGLLPQGCPLPITCNYQVINTLQNSSTNSTHRVWQR